MEGKLVINTSSSLVQMGVQEQHISTQFLQQHSILSNCKALTNKCANKSQMSNELFLNFRLETELIFPVVRDFLEEILKEQQ